ncbi:hypothetical protein [Consotaella salsifontis]|uniref:Uncharacterized protein n=1 Tax=Consotaella salsifontis TaxID=1365950 RepID=A0A1T4S1J7_9HYPH|nr:hypothetical protein [Consotaella salsifontis]SKA22113.1 hypothetical protein SAMN05428963_108170 [Consotaella salsifontis]
MPCVIPVNASRVVVTQDQKIDNILSRLLIDRFGNFVINKAYWLCGAQDKMKYEVYGPFWAPRAESEASGEALRAFWDAIDNMVPDLPRAIGIYVFSTCHGTNYTPWYVGKTNAKTGFRGEIFQEHKLNHYIGANQRKNGYPAIHLVAKVEPTRGNFCRASGRSGREIDELETVMIGMALRANPHVRNSKKTWFNKNCQVPGIIGSPIIGRPADAVMTLRNSLNI